MNTQLSRSALLRKLNAAQFAVFEMHLYLDTHPDDLRAFSLHRKYMEQYCDCLAEYEERYGGLTIGSASGVEWVKNPWPWEKEWCEG